MGKLGQFKDLTGLRFGLLLASRVDHVENRRNGRKGTRAVHYWFCKCACGGTAVVRDSHLYGKRVYSVERSCGCLVKALHKSAAWHIKSRKEGTAFRRCLDQYKANARRRGLSWELTEQEFRELTQSPCHYTGELPSTVTKSKCEEYKHNGIDRRDNTQGYTRDNCVPCCAVVNQMKADITLERFVELCKKVSERF